MMDLGGLFPSGRRPLLSPGLRCGQGLLEGGLLRPPLSLGSGSSPGGGRLRLDSGPSPGGGRDRASLGLDFGAKAAGDFVDLVQDHLGLLELLRKNVKRQTPSQTCPSTSYIANYLVSFRFRRLSRPLGLLFFLVRFAIVIFRSLFVFCLSRKGSGLEEPPVTTYVLSSHFLHLSLPELKRFGPLL